MMKFQTISVILVFLLIGVASGSLLVTVSAAASLSPYAQAENATTVPTLIEGPTTVQTAPATSLTATVSLTPPTTVPTIPVTTTQTTVPTTTVTTQTTVPTTTVTTQTTVPTTTVTTQTTVPTIPVTTTQTTVLTTTVTTPTTSPLTTSPPTTVLVSTTLPTSFITIVTFQSQTPAVSIVETVNPNYTPTTYPIDLSTSRTPDIDAGMQPYDGPVPTLTTVVQTLTPINADTPVIVVPVNTSVEIPVRTVERLENISNASPYQTYTPAPTPASPRGPDLFWILLLAVLAIAGGGGIALLSRSYRGRQQGSGEDVSATPNTGANPKAGEGSVAAEGHVTLAQVADYDPATTEIEHLMQMLNRLVQNSQNSLHNPLIRLDDLIRLSGISTLPIPERVAQWGSDHGYVVVSRDFQNEALLFRQTPVPGEPDLGIMYIGDFFAEDGVPPAPKKPGLSGDPLEDR